MMTDWLIYDSSLSSLKYTPDTINTYRLFLSLLIYYINNIRKKKKKKSRLTQSVIYLVNDR